MKFHRNCGAYKNNLHLGCDGSALMRTETRIGVALLSGLDTAEGQNHLPAEPGSGKAITGVAGQAKPIGDNWSLAKYAAAR